MSIDYYFLKWYLLPFRSYFAAYVLGIVFVFTVIQNNIRFLWWIYWIYDQYPILHISKFTKTWGRDLIDLMTRLKRQPVCILVKTDEVCPLACFLTRAVYYPSNLQINNLFRMILYVQKNEETSCIKLIHFSEQEEGIPSELEPNAKSMYEACSFVLSITDIVAQS